MRILRSFLHGAAIGCLLFYGWAVMEPESYALYGALILGCLYGIASVFYSDFAMQILFLLGWILGLLSLLRLLD
jgi:hypothetical protein